MAFVVTPLLTDIDLAESATPWSSAALDPAFFKQGSNSAGFYMSKNARSSETVTPAASVAWSTYTLPHLYFWTASSVAALMEPKTTGTGTASGLTVRVTLVSGAYREWHVAGADTWDGSWSKAFVIDMSHSGTQLYASTGTWTNGSNIASVTWYYDLSNSGNIRNVPANTWLDAIRVGEGLQVHNTSAADAAFGFAEIAADDELVANQYGVLQSLDVGAAGVFGCAGRLEVGDSTSTNHLDFASTDETLVFLERDGSGYGLVNAGLYALDFVGNSTGTDQDVLLGTKVGTGDTMSGRNGTQIRSGGSTVDFSVDVSDSALHNVAWYGSTIAGALSGITNTAAPTTLFEFGGCTFDGSDQVNLLDAVCRSNNYLNTTAPSTSGALAWVNGTTDVKYSLFVNNTVAIEIPTLSGDVAFTGMEFSGNTNDVRYEGASDYDLNWTDASGAPTIQNAGAGTLTAVNTVTLTLENVVVDSQCAIYAAAGGVETVGAELMNETSVSATVTEPYAFTSTQPIEIRVRNSSGTPRYFPVTRQGSITADGFTLRIDQLEDTIAS